MNLATLEIAVKKSTIAPDVRQLRVDLKEYLDERGCDFKCDMNTRDNNDALIDLKSVSQEAN